MQIRICELGKSFGHSRVLQKVTFDVADGELFFLLGPSGCGKSTLLRTIAGFYEPDDGELWFGDRRMNGVAPHRRNTAMVFQNYALWPHRTVVGNVGYGLEVRGTPYAERVERVIEALRVVRMEEYADRLPNQLSGGQQQRVALARAIVVRPDLLLLDEPLSNLDARLRMEMREEIRRIHDATGITTIYVTHDQKEALSMADRMAVMRLGVVEQLGRPREVYRRPCNRFVAEFIGEANWISGVIDTPELGSGFIGVRTNLGLLHVADGCGGIAGLTAGQSVQVGFRPESVRLGEGRCNTLMGRFVSITYLGEVEQYLIEVPGGAVLKAFEQNPRDEILVGGEARFHVDPAHLFVLSCQSSGVVGAQ